MARYYFQGMKFFAGHGYYAEEKSAGNTFIVDLEYDYPSSGAETSDKLKDTLDYTMIWSVIKEEMMVHSDLLEHLGRRILDRVKQCSPEIRNIKLKITKCNPPFGGRIEGIGVELDEM